MSEIITDLVWYPPQFPEQGRLPTAPEQVGANCKQQDSHEIAYRDQLCAAASRREEPGHLEYAIDAELKGVGLVRYGTAFMPEGRVLMRHLKQQNYLEHGSMN